MSNGTLAELATSSHDTMETPGVRTPRAPRPARGRGAAILAAALALPAAAHAQDAPTPPFTAAQAEAGAETYRAKCVLCHGAELEGKLGPPLTGKAFRANWYVGDRTLGDLFKHISENMPMTDPGSLTQEEYAALTAFLLLHNGHEPNGAELVPDIEALAAYPLTPPDGSAGGAK